jgi:hypothetical protein
MTCFALLCGVCFLLGYAAARQGSFYVLPALLLAGLVTSHMRRLTDEELRHVVDDEIGAVGESQVAACLRQSPDSHTVIHDLTFEGISGNIDHLVVGPTGVFAIDAKNWCGMVSAAGDGELLLNGMATPKPEVRRFIARAMGLRLNSVRSGLREGGLPGRRRSAADELCLVLALSSFCVAAPERTS